MVQESSPEVEPAAEKEDVRFFIGLGIRVNLGQYIVTNNEEA